MRINLALSISATYIHIANVRAGAGTPRADFSTYCYSTDKITQPFGFLLTRLDPISLDVSLYRAAVHTYPHALCCKSSCGAPKTRTKEKEKKPFSLYFSEVCM